jgi:hypothetical protein
MKLNQVDKLKEMANTNSEVLKSVDATVLPALMKYGRLYEDLGPLGAVHFLASLCSTVIGNHIDFVYDVSPEKQREVMGGLLDCLAKLLAGHQTNMSEINLDD